MTLELSLSRAEVKRLASRLVSGSRDQANYRALTDVEAAKKVPQYTVVLLYLRKLPVWQLF
jgi:hypothetical protein